MLLIWALGFVGVLVTLYCLGGTAEAFVYFVPIAIIQLAGLIAGVSIIFRKKSCSLAQRCESK